MHLSAKGGTYTMLLRLCPRCRRPTSARSGYCPQCRPIAEREREETRAAGARRYNAKRDKKLEAFYKTAAWRALSPALLSEREYKCELRHEGCTKLAVEVHHVKPLDTPEGWTRRLDPTNCKIVCLNCHNFAHKRFQKRGGSYPRG